jgi:hypothetical protein
VIWATALTWIVARRLSQEGAGVDSARAARDSFGQWHLRSTLVDLVIALGSSENAGWRAADTVELLLGTGWEDCGESGENGGLEAVVSELADSEAGRRYLRVNSWDDVLWFNREALEEVVGWLELKRILDGVVADSESAQELIAEAEIERTELLGLAEDSGYNLFDFLNQLSVSDEVPAAED